jgi:hypothetical protein
LVLGESSLESLRFGDAADEGHKAFLEVGFGDFDPSLIDTRHPGDLVAQNPDLDCFRFAIVHGADLDLGKVAVSFNLFVLIVDHFWFSLIKNITALEFLASNPARGGGGTDSSYLLTLTFVTCLRHTPS